MDRFPPLPLLLLALVAQPSISPGQTGGGAAVSPAPVDLVISGPHVVHRGENLWFTATLRNRSGKVMAVPSIGKSRGWTYIGGEWWKIIDKRGKPLNSKPPVEILFDNNVGMPTYQDSDFVLLKPGETIQYTHAALGDPSDRFAFPGTGDYSLSLSWNFCAPKVNPHSNGTVEYACGITRSLSQSVKEVLLATPSFDVKSNVWTIHLE
jgi:hypothetical protein